MDLPNELTKNDITNFIAGAISILIIRFMITDLEGVVLNIFSSINITSKFTIALILGVIVYLLLKTKWQEIYIQKKK